MSDLLLDRGQPVQHFGCCVEPVFLLLAPNVSLRHRFSVIERLFGTTVRDG